MWLSNGSAQITHMVNNVETEFCQGLLHRAGLPFMVSQKLIGQVRLGESPTEILPSTLLMQAMCVLHAWELTVSCRC
jgi:hypothetical protein